MEKKESRKKLIIILIIIIAVIIIAAIVAYFILNKTNGFSFGFAGFDFSSSNKALNAIGEATDKNTFDSAKLNPFANGTG